MLSYKRSQPKGARVVTGDEERVCACGHVKHEFFVDAAGSAAAAHCGERGRADVVGAAAGSAQLQRQVHRRLGNATGIKTDTQCIPRV
jgi:hypothetical protein